MRSLPSVAASMVVIFLPSAAEIGVMQERMACPSTCTVQAPHSAAPQPNLVPVMPSVSRSAQRMGVLGSTSTWWSRPLTLSVLMIDQGSKVEGQLKSCTLTGTCDGHLLDESAWLLRQRLKNGD